MAIGTIGVTRAADMSINDIEMYYNYMPDRYTSNTDIIKLVASDLLQELKIPSTDSNYYGTNSILEGLYDLKLPASIFNQLGIYTIYIKPKTILATIADCSVLSALPTVKGILLNINDPVYPLPTELTADNALQGYRVEYVNSDGTKLRNTVRYIVTSNKVSVSMENVGNTNQKSQRYRFNSLGTQIFLQLTPSSASDVKPNATPFIGDIGQTILISNTFFNPLVIEIELVENTIDTISDIVGGNMVKDIQNGELTHYDKNLVITRQFNLYQIKDNVSDAPLFEVKERKSNM